MKRKNDAIEHIEEQIKKLENIEELPSIEENSQETTKVFDNNLEEMINTNDEEEVEILDVEEDETSTVSKENDEQESIITKPEKKEKKSKKVGIIIFLIVLIILILIFGFFLLVNGLDRDRPTYIDEKELTEEERADVLKKYGLALEGVVYVHYSQHQELLTYEEAAKLVDMEEKVNCSVKEIYKDGKVYLNKCSVDGIITKASYGVEQKVVEVVAEDILNVYVDKKTNKATFEKPKDISLYNTYVVNCGGKYSEPLLLSATGQYVLYFDSAYNLQMKNYVTDEKVLPNLKYTGVMPIKLTDTLYDTKYIAVIVNDYYGIYDITNGEQVISPMYSWFVSSVSGMVGINNSIETVSNNLIVANDGKNYGVIDYTNNKAIISFDYKILNKNGSYIWAIDNENKGHVFDVNGKEYLTEGYDELYSMAGEKYILVRQKEDVKLVQIDGNVLYNYGKIDNIGDRNFALLYDSSLVFQMKDSTSEENCIELTYDPTTKTGDKKSVMCGGVAKPVLYLYPKKTTNVTVTFEKPELLETTYPKFNGMWQLKADNAGNLVDKNGKKYYALYWDEKNFNSVDFSQGFYVEKDEAIEFLEEKLSYIGLNDRERNEFIMYWLPVLEKNGKSLVYFELTEERESYNRINISPKPDTLLRVVIHIKKVNEKVNIKKQSLVKVKRIGFVAVEWGGTTY